MLDGLKSEIEYLRDIKEQFWIAGLSSFGGGFAFLAFNLPMFLKIIALVIGSVLSLLFFDNYFKKGDMIENRINYLKKKGG